MKQIIQFFTLTLLFTAPLTYTTPTRTVKLENNILSMIDGKQLGINGENIAVTKKYQAAILDIILGANTKTGRQGAYLFNGKHYNAQELRAIEEEFTSATPQGYRDQMHAALNQMRDDFERISEGFKDTAKASRPIMAMLIEESCQKRERGTDSLILIWAKSKENEYTLFNRHIKSIKDFEIFMTDLYNFLGDLVSSCPIAQKQFKDRLEKFGKIHHLLSVLAISPDQQQKFLKYVQNHLNTIDAASINEAKIKELYSTFNK